MAKKKRMAAVKLPQEIAEELRRFREERWPWLELNGRGLNEIPEEVFALTDLKDIDLSGNELRSIPERLWDLPNLRSVNLIGNPVEILPDRPGLFVDVPIYLRCGKQIDPKNIALVIGLDTSQEDADSLIAELRRTRSLRRLTIGEWNLRIGEDHPEPGPAIRKILDSLANWDFLESLSLRGLWLGAVPESVRQLQRLKDLRLDALGLRDLPDWIGQLDLESFSVIDNKLSAVPDSFRNLGHLKSLNLHWNPLDQIPKVIFDLVSLKWLGMIRCDIREVPADILRLHRLKFLDL